MTLDGETIGVSTLRADEVRQAHADEITIEELRLLIQETVAQTLADLLRDPDDGLEVREDLRRELRGAMQGTDGTLTTKSASDVAAQLGLRW
jgi:hypothetical protein